jgi:hypothetical protein
MHDRAQRICEVMSAGYLTSDVLLTIVVVAEQFLFREGFPSLSRYSRRDHLIELDSIPAGCVAAGDVSHHSLDPVRSSHDQVTSRVVVLVSYDIQWVLYRCQRPITFLVCKIQPLPSTFEDHPLQRVQ